MCILLGQLCNDPSLSEHMLRITSIIPIAITLRSKYCALYWSKSPKGWEFLTAAAPGIIPETGSGGNKRTAEMTTFRYLLYFLCIFLGESNGNQLSLYFYAFFGGEQSVEPSTISWPLCSYLRQLPNAPERLWFPSWTKVDSWLRSQGTAMPGKHHHDEQLGPSPDQTYPAQRVPPSSSSCDSPCAALPTARAADRPAAGWLERWWNMAPQWHG